MTQQQGLVTRETGPMSITTQERGGAHEALDKLIDSGIGGSTWDPNVAAAFMDYAAKKQILLTPVLGAFRMRPGWELAFTKLKVDTSKSAKLVYKVSLFDDDDSGGGEWGDNTPLAFHKPLLNMIRTHLGIDPKGFTRIGEIDPLCHEYQMNAEYLGVDGQIHTLAEQGGLDLRDDAPAVKKMYREARGKTADERRQKAEAAVERKRAKILQHATTNTEERLIISFGFRSSYTKKELDSKFIVCVRPLYTGYHPDPEIQRMLIGQMLDDQKHASRLLYGPGTGPSAPTETSLGLSPQITSGGTAAEQMFGDDEEIKSETNGNGKSESESSSISVTPYVLKSGRSAGKLVAALSDNVLSMLMSFYDEIASSVKDEGQLADIQADRTAILAEVASRKAGEPEQAELKL